MAYTPYYAPYSRPMGYYNPSMPQQDMQTNQPQYTPYQAPMQQGNDTMLFVLNENEASAYPVTPNSSVVLWDKNQKTFYIKTANAQGIPSMQIYDFQERAEKPQTEATEHKCTCGDKFVTKEEFDALKSKFEDLLARSETDKPKTKKAKEGDE